MDGYPDVFRNLQKSISDPSLVPSYIGDKLRDIPQVVQFEPVLRLALRMKGAEMNPEQPDLDPVPTNGVLRSEREVKEAVTEVKSVGLYTHPLTEKNWDHLNALRSILATTTNDAAVFDAGGATYSPLVEWLYLYGYEDLYVYNIDFDDDFRRGPIEYVDADFTNTGFDPSTFDVVTSLSVIEHGVPIESMLEECYRILKPGGRLIVSTDFWPDKRDTDDLTTSYGGSTQEWMIYDVDEIETFNDTAAAVGFELTGEVDFSTGDPVVEYWDQEYTFILLEFTREAD